MVAPETFVVYNWWVFTFQGKKKVCYAIQQFHLNRADTVKICVMVLYNGHKITSSSKMPQNCIFMNEYMSYKLYNTKFMYSNWTIINE